jgi:hypothetical protein
MKSPSIAALGVGLAGVSIILITLYSATVIFEADLKSPKPPYECLAFLVMSLGLETVSLLAVYNLINKASKKNG